MATMRYSQVRAHPGGTIRYIANKDKIISDKVHDVYNVLNYMGEPESTERIYSFARHCSPNPALAEKQMELNRQRYYASKKGGVQGLADGAQELLGLHFFMSYSEADSPTQYLMDLIAMKIAMHPLLKDFAVFGANHFDKAHRHTHFFVSAYSVEGKPRKLCMRYEDYNDLRRYANRLCVEHGLSVIDLAVLRSDPEYSDWIDGVIAEGKVAVHPEKEEHKRNPKQKATTRQIYYKWMKEREEFDAEEYRKLTPGHRFAKNYFYTFDGKVMYPISGDPKERVYAIPINDGNGRRRSTLELTVRLVLTIADKEGAYIRHHDRKLYDFLKSAKVDWDLQNMYNAMCTARELNVESANEIPARLADIGKQMNALRQEKRRHEGSIKKHEQIIGAHDTYVRVRPKVEGVPEPDEADASAYREAYAILARNQVLSDQAFAELRARYQFEKRKVSDYEKRMPELNRQYRDLKKLEAITSRPAYVAGKIFEYSDQAECASLRRSGTVDDIISNSKARAETCGSSGARDRNDKEY